MRGLNRCGDNCLGEVSTVIKLKESDDDEDDFLVLLGLSDNARRRLSLSLPFGLVDDSSPY